MHEVGAIIFTEEETKIQSYMPNVTQLDFLGPDQAI